MIRMLFLESCDMTGRLLALAIYPAPYRVEAMKRLAMEFGGDLFFERRSGDFRDERYFSQGDYYSLDVESHYRYYKKCLSRIADYDVIVLFDYPSKAGLTLALRCLVSGTPYVLNSDGDILISHGSWIKEIVKRFFIKRASACFAGCSSGKTYFLSRGASKEKVYQHPFSELREQDILAEPVSREEKKGVRQELSLPVSGKLALAVGRFVDGKNYSALIDIWRKMPADWTLVIIGGGPNEAKLKRLASVHQMNNVMILGFMEREILRNYFKAADVFLHPATYEAYGLVINEAMAVGVPVVATDKCNAALELITNHKNGHIVKSLDNEAFSAATVRILSDDIARESMALECLKAIGPHTSTRMSRIQIDAIRDVVLKAYPDRLLR